jgi:hypothetical protein
MRTLSSTLLAAQKDLSSIPFVKVTLTDEIADIVRLRWERLYAGSETDAYHAVVMPADGSLLRLRVDPAGPTLYYQRTAAPDDQSDFSGWTSLGSVTDAGVALTANGSDVLRAYVVSNGSDIKVEGSSNNGASFGSTVTAATLANVVWLTAALKSNGDAVLIYADATTVYAVRRTTGTWGTPAAWSHSANSIDGVTMALFGDFHVAIAGTDTNDNPRLWTAVYGDGVSRAAGTWSVLSNVAEAEDGSDVTFLAPFLAYVDTARLFFVEAYAGTVSYSQPQWTWFPSGQSFEANAWREPVPFDFSNAFGTAIAGIGSYAWLSTPDGVWRAALATSETELTDDVLELSLETRHTSGGVKIVLRNDDGRYNDLPNGAFSVIQHDAQVEVELGFVTTQDEEVSAPGLKYWLDSWEHTSAGGEATLVLHASNTWSLIERWRARRQHTWQAGDKAISQILSFVVGRAGVELIHTGISFVATNHEPDFTIHPGESGLQAVRRLLAMASDSILMSNAIAQLFESEAADTSGYEYGTDHPILHARYESPALDRNRFQVFGDDLLAQEYDWPGIEDQFDNVRQVFDLTLTTQTNVEDRAAIALRQETLTVSRGELVTPVNCGQDVYDVVSVTDSAAGLSDIDFRVAGIDVRYVRRSRVRRSPVYEQRLHLSNV